MRALSFVLAIAFALGVPGLGVSAARDSLPGVGTFTYSGPAFDHGAHAERR